MGKVLKKIISLYINGNTSNVDKLILLSFVINFFFLLVLIYDFASPKVRMTEAKVYLSSFSYSDNPNEKNLNLYYDEGENEDLVISNAQAVFFENTKTIEVILTPLFGYFKYVEIDGKKIYGDHTQLICFSLFSIVLFLFYPLTLKAIDDKRFAFMGELFSGSEPTLTRITILYMINFAFSIYGAYMLLRLFK